MALLNESGIQNTWCLGEAQVDDRYFDHSWIEINGDIFDIAICRPLHSTFQNGPVIKNIDVKNNQPTTTLYGVISGYPDEPMTQLVKSLNLSQYLLKSPIRPTYGTWKLIEQVARHRLERELNLNDLINKYHGQYFTLRP